MGEIRALCISEKRGTQKHALDRVFFMTEHGIDGDAHAGDWHRQVSLLGLGEIDDFRARGADVDFGAFGENVVAEGFRFKELPLGTRLHVGDVFLEITQIGKECHSHCQIYHQVGDCIMPREGVFARVLHGGTLRPGDALSLFEGKLPFDA
ncbi:MAG: MOSC domain-containing protein, partial [Selenomonas sp.]|nr:MOSC domain-containing protein [Selenomonas sp.]